MGMPSMWATSSHSFGHWLRRALVCGRRDPIFGFGCLMPETPPLRDHSKPCEHGHKLMHNAEFVGNTVAIVPPCPGGREVTDDDLRMMLDDIAKEMYRPRDACDG